MSKARKSRIREPAPVTEEPQPDFTAEKAFPITCDPADTRNVTARKVAEQITAPEANAWRVLRASEGNAGLGDMLDTAGALAALRRLGKQVNEGDMTRPEAMLINQAVALESLSVRLIERGLSQTALPQLEAFLRLGLKAQSQSRLAIEALAGLKQGPLVFARGQFNVANGPQQVNNGTAPRAIGSEIPPNGLSGSDELRSDCGAPGSATRGDPAVEAVGEIDGAKKRRG